MQVITRIRKSRKRDYADALSRFFVRVIGADVSDFTVVVTTEQGLTKETGGCGATSIDYEAGEIHVIFDSSLKGKDILFTLAHEFIHVRQMAFGELVYVGETPYWHGRRASRYKYEDRPWEIEAYSKMVDLIRQIPIHSPASNLN